LVSSRRRSSFSAGIGSRMTTPSLAGFSPSSDFRMAVSMFLIAFLSKGVMTSRDGSGTLTPASWFSGMLEP